MLGFSCDLYKINAICKKFNIPILEDNCEAIGAKNKNSFLGTCGDVGVFSFDFGKIITTGEGGLILTNNKKIYQYCKEYHDHGHMNLKNFSRGNDKARISGFNYRATEFQGAIGKVQLKKLNILLRDNKKKYMAIQKILKNKFILRKVHDQTTPNYDTFIFFENNLIKRNKIIKILYKHKIGTKNLPDAIKWHCSYFWRHCLPSSEIKASIPTKKKLSKAIAIPINYKISIEKYESF
jgi:8-amino-3,8-dideoxy-alpha-D-manno-octulosonate transaminase